MKTNKLCPLPFKQLYIHSSGKVYPCGFLQNHILLGDVKDSSLNEIWEGEIMNEFRESHKSGNSIACKNEQDKHNCHLLHLNKSEINVTNAVLERLDFMVDSACNIKCVMCTNIFEEASGFSDAKFWEDLEKNVLPKLKQIEIIGGEPFILKNTFKAIEIGSRVNKDLEWRLTTNAMFEWGNTIQLHLDKIFIDSLAISIDSLSKERFNKIRVGGDLSKVLNNVDHFVEYKNQRAARGMDFKLIANFVVQKENYDEVPDFVKFCRKVGVSFYPILLREPEQFSILTMPPEKINEILNFYIDQNFILKDFMLLNLIIKISKNLPPHQLLSSIEKIKNLQADMSPKDKVK